MQRESTTRYCSKCKQHLPANEFGKHNYCRICKAIYYQGYKARKRTEALLRHPDGSLKPKPPKKKQEWTPERRRAARSRRYQDLYGVDVEFIETLSSAQGDVCSICAEPQQIEDRLLTALCYPGTNRIESLVCNECSILSKAVPILAQRPDKIELVREHLIRLAETDLRNAESDIEIADPT